MWTTLFGSVVALTAIRPGSSETDRSTSDKLTAKALDRLQLIKPNIERLPHL
jgi:hypothetical protein